MGNEKLWWTWGMADRGTIVNSSLLLYSTDDIWNVTINQDIYNHTANITWQTDGSPSNSTTTFDQELIISIVIGAVLCLLILITIIGNLFVISAIIIERHLQSVANYLILSLAVADLLVACLVMPLGAVYVVSEKWNLGTELCDIWTSTDVLCCTASILHLVAIALDRYWAVTNIDYMNQRTAKRIGLMIAVVWMVSIAGILYLKIIMLTHLHSY
ncbi:5-hydroxytryptamine receptor-like [Aphidius gifuensis]|uniref:5-hydroxytryptamine receptor-like n=1 Tax=Aphidius gifuensis TaxID=684658 RepID=UPI001CDC0A28|nr:5-hydroxytryptamine receptor-like [Aphidius gifuensis]